MSKEDSISRKKRSFLKLGKTQVILICKQEQKTALQKAAKAAGESMNNYILSAVETRMAIDQMPDGMSALINRPNKNGD